LHLLFNCFDFSDFEHAEIGMEGGQFQVLALPFGIAGIEAQVLVRTIGDEPQDGP
jgi:hypothetical protein